MENEYNGLGALELDRAHGSVEKQQCTLSMGGGKPIPSSLPDSKEYIVEFDGPDDPAHPLNWSLTAKLYISLLASEPSRHHLPAQSSAPAPLVRAKAFGVSTEVGTLGTTIYVLDFASGPLIWAPASELVGRRWPLTIGMVGGAIFTIASAVAKDIQTLIICRFFAGIFGASQLSVVPAVLSDIYNNNHRGIAIALYSLTVFIGPFSAPFIGRFIATSFLGWRWTLYIPAFMGFASGSLFMLFLKETYTPALLASKAATMRRQTLNWGIHAKQDELEVDFVELMRKYFTRPPQMLVTEPIILLISLYMPFISGLAFIGLIIGQVLACGFILSQHSVYADKLAANDNVSVPEWNLLPATIGAPVFTVGIFWFGWTGFTASIHWMVPIAAGVFIGFGVLCIFLPCFNYFVDSYLPLAASTVAANLILRSTVAANLILRSSVAAGFPLFSKQMFANLGVQWAGTLLGCLTAIMIPIPFAFRAYGPWLRGKSKLAP